MRLADVDIASHDVWRAGVPHATLALLRREAPVYRHPGTEPEMPAFFWALTRHADVQAANRDWQTFSSALGGTQLRESSEMLGEFRTIIDSDPPDHARLRQLVNRGFTPRMIAKFEDHYRRVTAGILDHAIAHEHFDFVTDVAAELPLVAIAELLGVPFEDRHKIMDWTNRLVGSTDPEYDRGPDDAVAAASELYVYAGQLAAQRREQPRDDIVTKLVTSMDGDALGEHEFELFVLALSVGGNETTRNAIAHGMLALLENPDQMTLLRERTSEVIGTATEEIIRYATPVTRFRRTATREVDMHGVTIRAGDPVVLVYASANNDETVFADPLRFDLLREPNPHVSFGGGGPHFCLGAHLARIEIRIMFEQLLARTRRIALDGDVARLRSSFLNGIKHLPVLVEPA